MSNPQKILDNLTFPPSLETLPPDLPEGVVSLFKDAKWNSARYDIVINDWTEIDRHLILSDFWDTATWVAWNLPIGVVVTLADFRPPAHDAGRLVGDLSDLGSTFDLIGTGKARSASLITGKMNDLVATFFWRAIDLNIGVVEMFDDLNYTGIRQALYLSEWPTDTYININKWHMHDRMSSASWKSLFDTQTFTFYQNTDGGGESFDQVISWGQNKSTPDLRKFGFNDMVTSFDWSPLIPKREEIASFQLNTKSQANRTIGQSVSYDNKTDINQPLVLHVEDTTVATLTTSTTEAHVVGIKTTVSAPLGIGVSVELSYEYRREHTTGTSTMHESKFGINQTVVAQPKGVTKAWLEASIGTVPPAVLQTTATRWYDAHVTGSVRDPEHNNWYKRENEKVYVQLAGGLGLSANAMIEFTPHTMP